MSDTNDFMLKVQVAIILIYAVTGAITWGILIARFASQGLGRLRIARWHDPEKVAFRPRDWPPEVSQQILDSIIAHSDRSHIATVFCDGEPIKLQITRMVRVGNKLKRANDQNLDAQA